MPNFCRTMKPGLAASLLTAALLLLPAASYAEEQPAWRHATSSIGEPKYKTDFARFNYVNPDAPKGGELQLSENGTFDSFNPILAKGEVATGVSSLVFDTLLMSSEDEITTSYGLLAEGVSYPADISSATFRLRAEARWADGRPVTPEDVIFSFDRVKEHNPLFSNYYRHVVSAEKTGERDVTFRFDEKNNLELPNILGQFPILPKHWWEGQDAEGKKRDIGRTTLEPVMGSGPYKIAAFQPGGSIRFELRDDYWGKDLNVNVGRYNFRTINYVFFSDRSVEFEAFRAGNVHFYRDNSASHWATAYDFPAMKDGRVIREEIENPLRATGVMQAFVPNLRREKFKDQRVREALNYAFDFEDLNRSLAHNAYQRVDSYFWGTELASSGLPEGREKEILEELKDKVPAAVFDKPYKNPVNGDPQKVRDNLRKSLSLFKEAGYELKGSRLVNSKTGEPFRFEILLPNPSLERTVTPFVNSVRKIGIDARIRTVDDSQYTNRVRSFDYDMIYGVWAQTLVPGNEQSDYWGSASVDRPGSMNYAGIADPAIDELIRKIIFAPNREELVATTRALDRVLLAHHYVVPLFYSKAYRIAYWSHLARPEELPYYGMDFPAAWWSKSAAAK
ncbi:extracellular solute-binding protein [Sinorhizobium medicae]|uniref:extracellular solute-binding protein n=1 Tax=Sinorhizobium medicae TaxID=110321 RepID=UPI0003751D6E|nr:extracellular solute-binding protein [Sinorhizobium medicae]WQO45603.1 extracellular solute-binding protein [Sinorhizobium medicae]WQO65768.1 extracellular solute-binding protein [Sinorhizobium medicae]WQO72899.1 extracellular solute-binding protein [Sinorhizobium medicae]WQO92207.1 extracellular solute-binding protein [Sinorhizobium medicae]